MKNLIFLLSIVLSFNSCSQNDENSKNENSIYGTWKLVAVYSNVGNGENNWNSVENGYTYIINADNSFESTKYNECSSGKIEVNAMTSTLSFIFDCNNFYPCEENSDICKEYFSISEGNLILSSTYQNCDEGCPQFKFEKIK